jgi:hypothetical protein
MCEPNPPVPDSDIDDNPGSDLDADDVAVLREIEARRAVPPPRQSLARR